MYSYVDLCVCTAGDFDAIEMFFFFSFWFQIIDNFVLKPNVTAMVPVFFPTELMQWYMNDGNPVTTGSSIQAKQ